MTRAAAFRAAVLQAGCVMCAELSAADRHDLGPATRTLDAHHVIREQTMRRAGVRDDAAWDPRAGVPVCRYHHAQHHAWRERIPRRLLPTDTIDFLRGCGLGYYLDREYPNPQVEGQTDPEGGVEGREDAA